MGKVKTINGGIDLTLLSNRLSASFDVYRRDTEGMLAKGETLPNVLGTKVPKINAANLRTNGWEMSLAWHDNFTLAENLSIITLNSSLQTIIRLSPNMQIQLVH